MTTNRLALALVLILIRAASGSAGQAEEPSRAPMRLEKGTIEVAVLGGTSLPVSAFDANRDHALTLASFAVGRVMTGRTDGNSLELILDATPLVRVNQPDVVRGWSISPLFVRWNFPPARRVRIFGEVAGGLLFTAQPVPPRTTTFNFLDQAGFGVRIEGSASHAWLAGYRFQHVSNGGRVRPNPGKNFNLVYFGVCFLR